ncbi:hypothetical protein Z043_108797 [Scleropages formosus]|uniref:Nucleolar protein 4-like n=1 Tax=Scleropages formosus TaxID=113540 RepID=A0A0P7VAN2_SCLFO|nr:hypothetical protein Z043_108797 [Scleropages formosus]
MLRVRCSGCRTLSGDFHVLLGWAVMPLASPDGISCYIARGQQVHDTCCYLYRLGGKSVTAHRIRCVDGGSAPEGSSLKRVAVVEDFFDIIYAMHVEMGTDPAKAPKHAGQKKTYKAIAETYAFLPREAVTRFLMSCGECQKRMHINPSSAEFKENDRPASLVPDLIDYNMPLTTTYLKQMKLQCMSANEQVSVDTDEVHVCPDLGGSRFL